MEPEQIEIVDAATLERRRKDASRKKAERAAKKQAAEHRAAREVEQYFEFHQLVGWGQLAYGGCPADSLADFASNEKEWLFCAARFMKAAGLNPKIRDNDSLNSYEQRVLNAVCEYRHRTDDHAMPYLSLRSGKFDSVWENVYPKHAHASRIYIAEYDKPLIARGITLTGAE